MIDEKTCTHCRVTKSVGLFADKPTVPYSPDPWRYDPMCRSCHVKRDSYGAA